MEEPLVAELLRIHANEVATLMEAIKGLDSAGTCIIDELFVVRFIVADATNAEKNVKNCLEWRRRNRDVLLEAARGRLPFEDIMSKHVKKGVCGWLSNQYLINVVRAGYGNAYAMMRDLTYEQVVAHLLFHNEYLFAIIDEQTRRTGRLCRLVNVLDLQGFNLRSFDRKFAKATGEATHVASLYYPLLTKFVALVNLPATFRILHSIAKVFASRVTLESQRLCPARTNKGSAENCPFLRKFGASGPAAVPHFLGGTYPLPPSLRLDDDEMEVE